MIVTCIIFPLSFDLFLIDERYIGHGAGEKYFNEGELKDIMKIKSAVFLIGCSSAKQIKAQNYTSKGESELAGISIEYLLCNW